MKVKIQRPHADRVVGLCYIAALDQQGFKIVSRSGLQWLECKGLTGFSWLLHAFSTRLGGVSDPPAAGLNLGFVQADQHANVERNRARFFEQLGAKGFCLAAIRQIHSAHIYQVAPGARRKLEYRPPGSPAPQLSEGRLPAGDALLTDQPGVLLSVRTADCLPILLVDPLRPAVAAVHAGWRGALKRVVEKTVGVMRQVFGSDPCQMRAAFGPCIQTCCYAVGEEVVAAFCGCFRRGERFFRAIPREPPAAAAAARRPLLFSAAPPHAHGSGQVPAAYLDLVAVARDQLQEAGLRASNIQATELCTACRTDLFFSNRTEGSRTGRMMAVIGIQPSASHRV